MAWNESCSCHPRREVFWPGVLLAAGVIVFWTAVAYGIVEMASGRQVLRGEFFLAAGNLRRAGDKLDRVGRQLAAFEKARDMRDPWSEYRRAQFIVSQGPPPWTNY